LDLGKQTNVKAPIKALTLKKVAILEEEKQFWLLERRKGEEVARRVIERVDGVVKEAIMELEGREISVASNSNADSANILV
jgi:hypothetical protein